MAAIFAKREVCLLVGRGDAILWADASDSAYALPDSRPRWEAIWRLRDELEVIAHSHPDGPAAFSAEDRSTMAAIDSALGKVMRYCVVAPRAVVWSDDVHGDPWWAHTLRLASGMEAQEA
jgi:Prokaryotic homologs of the JAB domain